VLNEIHLYYHYITLAKFLGIKPFMLFFALLPFLISALAVIEHQEV
jgi:hypothetical protein